MANNASQDRFEDVRLSVEIATKLAADPDTFLRAFDAFQAKDAERFQSELARAAIVEHCHRICQWFCSKHCVHVCRKLAGPIEATPQLDPKEVLAFTLAVGELAAKNKDLLAALIKAVDDGDADAYQSLLKRAKIAERYWHQLCHWLCSVKCRLVCRELCPQGPAITKVGLIPATHISPVGLGSGPSVPAGTTPADNFSPGPYGHHPFGGLTFIEGSIFTVANADAYKVEWASNVAGPWTPIVNPVDDFDFVQLDYQRTPTAGWFAVADMGIFKTSLANWTTPSPDGLYYLKLTVRNTLAVEFASGLVPIKVDNTPPKNFTLQIKQNNEGLPCCGKVSKAGGPLEITVTGEDENFEALSISLRGGCNVSYPVFSKTYNGNTADTGAPPPGVTFTYDPWAAGVEPCCYVLEVVVSDRAIVSNTLWAHHVVSTVHSITIT